ncbi:orotate phosphoribosyltransferase [Paenibacillus sp. NPDC057967]|uniref:orotate phosphoribosyltransferase n=1 Tax=Paenibacillus sp. NPDC057967 TaxID=3346293 RepID=UPI0036DF108C
MTRSLANQIYDTAHLNGTFTLRSGQVSNEYFDKYLFEADPGLLRTIAEQLVPLIPAGTEVLAGLEMGGIPVATAVSLQSGVPAAFVRKKSKEYGTCKLAEGASIAGKRVCVVEDVITTGGQVMISTQELREAGAIVENVLCVIERNPDGRRKLAEIGVRVHALFTMEQLLSGRGEG